MIYTDMTKKAINIMYKCHKDQFDKSGAPYVFHPWHVAEQMKDADSTVVALLHDTVEDTNMTFKELKEYGFNERIMCALKLLTHEKNIDYYEYIKKVGNNPLARTVKIADLEHNMEIDRLNNIKKEDIDRIEKYKSCHNYLVSIEKNN